MDLAKRARHLARRVGRALIGEQTLQASSFLQGVLAFRLDGEAITDLNLCVPFTYQRRSVLGTLLFYKGAFEEAEISLLLGLLIDVPCPVVLDIGANIGWHDVRWAAARPELRIFAFEPSRRTREVLRENLRRNGVASRVVVVPMAVSDTCGTSTFHECEDSGYSSLKDTGRKRVVSTRNVRVTTIDDFVRSQGLVHVSAMKIDVEGFETEVLHGAVNTLDKWQPDVLVEIYGGKASNPRPLETIHFMQSLGYETFVWKNDRLVPFDSHSDRHFNYLFTKRRDLPAGQQ